MKVSRAVILQVDCTRIFSSYKARQLPRERTCIYYFIMAIKTLHVRYNRFIVLLLGCAVVQFLKPDLIMQKYHSALEMYVIKA